MFKITQNTFRDFTLAEVRLMVAINQLEAKRKVGANEGSLRDLRLPFVRERGLGESTRSWRECIRVIDLTGTLFRLQIGNTGVRRL